MARMPSVMAHTFSRVPSANIPRSSFDRSHGHKTTFNESLLVPIFWDEVLPGDTMSLSMTGFARMSTPIKPLMDNSYFNTFFFFVPNRLLWDHWQEFNGEQKSPGDSTDYLVPEIVAPAGGFGPMSVFDYFGLPVGVPGIRVNALYFRAYQLIYNEWFRDENLRPPFPISLGDGPDDPAGYFLVPRGKRHDYFTSCLPWPQKGESVTIPLGQFSPVVPSGPGALPEFHIGGNLAHSSFLYGTNGQLPVTWNDAPQSTGTAQWGTSGLVADLSNATAATINQLRQAFAIQRLYERDARGGTRYTEIVRSHFGVISPDARLQRPEYLGGGQSPITISPVAQTSETASSTPQGNLAAFGTSTMHRHGFSKSFTEHGVLIGIVSVRADLTYQQGIDRHFSRRGRFDFYWPALSHIGEQAVLSQEIFADGSADDQTVFGYQERYAEYRYKRSAVTGEFRSSYPQSLDVWHLSQDFATRPLLNASFIQEAPPFDRVIAVPSEPHFIADFYFRYRCARPMPVYGVPGLIDHF